MNRRLAAGFGALVVAVVASACTAPSVTGRDAVTRPTECVVPRGAEQQDIDLKDSQEKPWRRPDGAEVVVYFETQKLSGRYEGLVRQATAIWSESPCLQAQAVSSCPADVNCVVVKEERASKDRSTDGEFDSSDQGAYRNDGTITLYTEALDGSSDNGALATVVHEMGHAFGLKHRRDSNDVMHEQTSDRTNPVPDAIDFKNLAVIYGDLA
jgi:hypothetical protein